MSRSLMTPPYSSSSDESTPPPAQLNGELAMSTTFRKDADLLAGEQPDTVLLSADNVAFYVHSNRLRAASTNALCGLLVPGAERTRPRTSSFGIDLPVLVMPDDSNVLNIVLHAMYGLDATRYNPPFEAVSRAVVALTGIYGVPISTIFSPVNAIYNALESLAVSQPLRVYALAGHYGIESLAVTASSYLLSYPLSRISDEDAEYMGGRYLRRLFFLHLGRIDRLKGLLNRPPDPHPVTQMCDPEDQKKVNRAWALGTSFLVFNAARGTMSSRYPFSADTAASGMEASLAPLVAQIWCPDCRAMLQTRLNQLCAEWSSVKRTI